MDLPDKSSRTEPNRYMVHESLVVSRRHNRQRSVSQVTKSRSVQYSCHLFATRYFDIIETESPGSV